MPEQIENRMVVDAYWNEVEYVNPSSNSLRRERNAYEQAEREGKKDE